MHHSHPAVMERETLKCQDHTSLYCKLHPVIRLLSIDEPVEVIDTLLCVCIVCAQL